MDNSKVKITLEKEHKCEAIQNSKNVFISSVDSQTKWLWHYVHDLNTIKERVVSHEIISCPYCGEILPYMDNAEKRIEILNSISVSDWSCSGNECKYVIGNASIQEIKNLLDIGFTPEQIETAIEACCGNDFIELDISLLAFNHTHANSWGNKSGFTISSDEVEMYASQ